MAVDKFRLTLPTGEVKYIGSDKYDKFGVDKLATAFPGATISAFDPESNDEYEWDVAYLKHKDFLGLRPKSYSEDSKASNEQTINATSEVVKDQNILDDEIVDEQVSAPKMEKIGNGITALGAINQGMDANESSAMRNNGGEVGENTTVVETSGDAEGTVVDTSGKAEGTVAVSGKAEGTVAEDAEGKVAEERGGYRAGSQLDDARMLRYDVSKHHGEEITMNDGTTKKKDEVLKEIDEHIDNIEKYGEGYVKLGNQAMSIATAEKKLKEVESANSFGDFMQKINADLQKPTMLEQSYKAIKESNLMNAPKFDFDATAGAMRKFSEQRQEIRDQYNKVGKLIQDMLNEDKSWKESKAEAEEEAKDLSLNEYTGDLTGVFTSLRRQNVRRSPDAIAEKIVKKIMKSPEVVKLAYLTGKNTDDLIYSMREYVKNYVLGKEIENAKINSNGEYYLKNLRNNMVGRLFTTATEPLSMRQVSQNALSNYEQTANGWTVFGSNMLNLGVDIVTTFPLFNGVGAVIGKAAFLPYTAKQISNGTKAAQALNQALRTANTAERIGARILSGAGTFGSLDAANSALGQMQTQGTVDGSVVWDQAKHGMLLGSITGGMGGTFAEIGRGMSKTQKALIGLAGLESEVGTFAVSEYVQRKLQGEDVTKEGFLQIFLQNQAMVTGMRFIHGAREFKNGYTKGNTDNKIKSGFEALFADSPEMLWTKEELDILTQKGIAGKDSREKLQNVTRMIVDDLDEMPDAIKNASAEEQIRWIVNNTSIGELYTSGDIPEMAKNKLNYFLTGQSFCYKPVINMSQPIEDGNGGYYVDTYVIGSDPVMGTFNERKTFKTLDDAQLWLGEQQNEVERNRINNLEYLVWQMDNADMDASIVDIAAKAHGVDVNTMFRIYDEGVNGKYREYQEVREGKREVNEDTWTDDQAARFEYLISVSKQMRGGQSNLRSINNIKDVICRQRGMTMEELDATLNKPWSECDETEQHTKCDYMDKLSEALGQEGREQESYQQATAQWKGGNGLAQIESADDINGRGDGADTGAEAGTEAGAEAGTNRAQLYDGVKVPTAEEFGSQDLNAIGTEVRRALDEANQSLTSEEKQTIDQMINNGANSDEIAKFVDGLPEEKREVADAYVIAQKTLDAQIGGIDNVVDAQINDYVSKKEQFLVDGTREYETALLDEKEQVYVVGGVDGDMTIIKHEDGSMENVDPSRISNNQRHNVDEEAEQMRQPMKDAMSDAVDFAMEHHAKTVMPEKGGVIKTYDGDLFVANVDGEDVSLVHTVYNVVTGEFVPKSEQPIVMTIDEALKAQDDYHGKVREAEEEAKAKAEEEARMREEEQKRAEEAKKKAEEEQKRAEEEAKKKAEEEAKKKAEEEAKAKAEEEELAREEEKKRAEEEAKKNAGEEALAREDKQKRANEQPVQISEEQKRSIAAQKAAMTRKQSKNIGHSAEWKEAQKKYKEAGYGDLVEMIDDYEPKDINDVAAMIISSGDLMWNTEDIDGRKIKGVAAAVGYGEPERKKLFTLFRTRANGGISVEEAGDRVAEMCKQLGVPFDDSDAMAGYNAIVEVLQSAHTTGDIVYYTEKRRVAEAESKYDDYEEQREMAGDSNEVTYSNNAPIEYNLSTAIARGDKRGEYAFKNMLNAMLRKYNIDNIADVKAQIKRWDNQMKVTTDNNLKKALEWLIKNSQDHVDRVERQAEAKARKGDLATETQGTKEQNEDLATETQGTKEGKSLGEMNIGELEDAVRKEPDLKKKIAIQAELVKKRQMQGVDESDLSDYHKKLIGKEADARAELLQMETDEDGYEDKRASYNDLMEEIREELSGMDDSELQKMMELPLNKDARNVMGRAIKAEAERRYKEEEAERQEAIRMQNEAEQSIQDASEVDEEKIKKHNEEAREYGGLIIDERSSQYSEPVRAMLDSLGKGLKETIEFWTNDQILERYGIVTRGVFEDETNTLIINSDYAGSDEEVVQWVVNHEITHDLENCNDNAVWNGFVELVKISMGDDFQKEFERVKNGYDQAYSQVIESGLNLHMLKDDEIIEEICANWAGDHNPLGDPEMAKKMVDDAVKHGIDAKSLSRLLLQYINNWINKLMELIKLSKKDVRKEYEKQYQSMMTAKEVWKGMLKVAISKANEREKAERKQARHAIVEKDVKKRLRDIESKLEQIEQSEIDTRKNVKDSQRRDEILDQLDAQRFKLEKKYRSLCRAEKAARRMFGLTDADFEDAKNGIDNKLKQEGLKPNVYTDAKGESTGYVQMVINWDDVDKQEAEKLDKIKQIETGKTGSETGKLDGKKQEAKKSAKKEKTPEDYNFRQLKPGEKCYVERQYELDGSFVFNGSKKIRSSADMAYLFKSLESKSIEHVFFVLIKDGKPMIVHAGMGAMAESLADLTSTFALFKRINPQSVVMVHNHPSGKLVPSRADINLWEQSYTIFGDKLRDAVIIDQMSGKYATFGKYGKNYEEDIKPSDGNDKEYKVYAFSKSVFSPDYKFGENIVTDSADVAKFVSAQRLGESGKLCMLSLDTKHAVNANLMLPFSEVNDSNVQELADEIAYNAHSTESVTVALYGSAQLDKNMVKKLNQELVQRRIKLLDMLSVDGRNYDSAYNHSMFEDEAQYWAGTSGKAEGTVVGTSGKAEGTVVGDAEGTVAEFGNDQDYKEKKQVRFSLVEDEDLKDRLNKGKKITAYRAMNVKDGVMNSPMAGGGVGGKNKGDRTDGLYQPQYGEWEKADEIYDNVEYGEGDEYGHIWIDKGDGEGSLRVAFNPYIHTSLYMLNDQFSAAWHRPNLQVVEVLVPESEAYPGEDAYKAKLAKNSIGETEWTDGVVARQLPEGKRRKVILTRYDMPVGIVKPEKYAKAVKEQLEGTDVEGIPFNVVTPEQREALVKEGIKIIYPEKKAGELAVRAYNAWLDGIEFDYEKEKKKYEKEKKEAKKKVTEVLNSQQGTFKDKDGNVVVEKKKKSVRFSIGAWKGEDKNVPNTRDIVVQYAREHGGWDIVEKMDQMVEMSDRMMQKNEDGEYEYKTYAKWANTSVVLDKYGNPAFTIIKKNGEYLLNIDASTNCKKREETNAVLNDLITEGLIGKDGLSEDDIITLKQIITKYGLEIACDICFVDERRYHAESQGKTVARDHNWVLENILLPGSGYSMDDLPHYNFAGDETIDMNKSIDVEKLNWKALEEKAKTTNKDTRLGVIVNNLLADHSLAKVADWTDFIGTEGKIGERKAGKEGEYMNKVFNKIGTAIMKRSEPQAQNLHQILSDNIIGSGTSYTYVPKTIGRDENGNLYWEDPKEGKKMFGDTDEARHDVYLIGGVRLQSFSDAQAWYWFDDVETICDLALKKLGAHKYTKELWNVKAMGKSGLKQNMSAVPRIIEGVYAKDTRWGKKGEPIAAGLDENGELLWADHYLYDGDKIVASIQSIDVPGSIEVHHTPGYSADNGVIGVGVSDEQIIAMQESMDYSQIIGFHSSLSGDVKHGTGLEAGKNYKDCQRDRKFGSDEEKQRWINGEINSTDNKIGKATDRNKALNGWNFYEALERYYKMALEGEGTSGEAEGTVTLKDVMDRAAKEYLDKCWDAGILPEFDQFAYLRENDWHGIKNFRGKLLIGEDGYPMMRPRFFMHVSDYCIEDGITGEYAPQKPVRMEFPTEEDAFGSFESIIKEAVKYFDDIELKRDEAHEAIKAEYRQKVYEKNERMKVVAQEGWEQLRNGMKLTDEQKKAIAKTEGVELDEVETMQTNELLNYQKKVIKDLTSKSRIALKEMQSEDAKTKRQAEKVYNRILKLIDKAQAEVDKLRSTLTKQPKFALVDSKKRDWEKNYTDIVDEIQNRSVPLQKRALKSKIIKNRLLFGNSIYFEGLEDYAERLKFILDGKLPVDYTLDRVVADRSSHPLLRNKEQGMVGYSEKDIYYGGSDDGRRLTTDERIVVQQALDDANAEIARRKKVNADIIKKYHVVKGNISFDDLRQLYIDNAGNDELAKAGLMILDKMHAKLDGRDNEIFLGRITPGVSGSFNIESGKLSFSMDSYGRDLTDSPAYTIIHEYTHKMLVDKIAQYIVTPWKLSEDEKDAFATLESIYAKVKELYPKNVYGRNTLYGASAMQEMAAEWFTPSFRDKLKGMKYEKKGFKNLWQRFVDAVLMLFGIKRKGGEEREDAQKDLDEAINTLIDGFNEKLYDKSRNNIASLLVDFTSTFHKDVIEYEYNKLSDEEKPEAKNRIRFALVDSNDPFYSNSAKAVLDVKQEKATPEQWLKMIEKNGGLKAGEDKWLCLTDWLKEAQRKGVENGGKASLTKDEVMEYIQENSIKIEETNYGIDNDKLEEMWAKYQGEFDAFVEEISNNQISKQDLDKIQQEYDDFSYRMYDKYGASYSMNYNQSEEEESKRLVNALKEAKEKYQYDKYDIYLSAFDKMVEKYGDDFGDAFDVNVHAGKLIENESYFDGINHSLEKYLDSGRAINGTRLGLTTGGLENKKEIAMTVPTIDPYNEHDLIHFGDAGNGRAVVWVRFGDAWEKTHDVDQEEVKKEYYKFLEEMSDKYGDGSGEMNEDIFAQMNQEESRKFYALEDGRSINKKKDGAKVLVVDEVQSKRHQDGREKGYYSKTAEKEYDKFLKEMQEKYDGDTTTYEWTPEELDKWNELAKKLDTSGVPDAPFDKNWMELGMKRMLRFAAENGYDKLAWTTGSQQAERYSIGAVIDEIWRQQSRAMYPKWAEYNIQKDGVSIGHLTVDKESQNVVSGEINGSDFDGTPLKDVVGKELADKMLGAEVDEKIEVNSLVGGEGMKGFYDKMIPNFMAKYVKKWGAKVGEVELDLPNAADRKMWSVDVTPEMKESVMKGQPMFALADVKERLKEKAQMKSAENMNGNDEARTGSVDEDKVIKSENFKRWFGDWENDTENASKVVDEDGKPLVLHHGTPRYGFTEFDTYNILGDEVDKSNVGSHFGDINTAEEFGDEDEMYNVYLNIRNPYETFDFFADVYNNAYLEVLNGLRKDAKHDETKEIFNKIYDVYPQLKDIDLDEVGYMGELFDNDEGLERTEIVKSDFGRDAEIRPDFTKNRNAMVDIMREMLKSEGYDGLKYENWYEGDGKNYCWVALEPEQIKSADTEGAMANNGEFDPKKKDIRFALVDPGEEPRRRRGESERAYQERRNEWRARMEDFQRRVASGEDVEDSQHDAISDEANRLKMDMMTDTMPSRKADESADDYNARFDEWKMRDEARKARLEELKQQQIDRNAEMVDDEKTTDQHLWEGTTPPIDPFSGERMSAEEWEEMMQSMKDVGNDVGQSWDKKQMEKDIHEEIIQRRRYIETSNLEDVFFVDDLVTLAKKSKDWKNILHDVPFYIEYESTLKKMKEEELGKRLEAGERDLTLDDIHVEYNPFKSKEEDRELLADIAKKVEDWFQEQYQTLNEEGVLFGATQLEDYVTHIWDFKRSPKDAVEKYRNYVTALRQRSPYTRHRVLPSLQDGLAMGLVPKYKDITGIILDYGHRATETIANKRMVDFLSNFGLMVDNGKDMPALMPIIVDGKNPDSNYVRVENQALDGKKVLRDAVPLISPVFGRQRILDPTAHPELQKWIDRLFWNPGSVMKKLNLSMSFFHHGALTETAIALINPARTAKVLTKGIFWDWAKNGKLPAMHDRSATRDAVNHLVTLGATNDYAATDVLNITTKLKNVLHRVPTHALGTAYVADMIDFLNAGSDKLLWDMIHDGYKIEAFKKIASEIRKKAEKQGWDYDKTDRALMEAGQFVNDTFGGQHWDVLGISPMKESMMRAILLSPDWTISTMRQALAPLGVGTLYDSDSFWTKMRKNGLGKTLKDTTPEGLRKKYGRQFWMNAAIYFGVMINALNAWMRFKDEEEQKSDAEEKRKTNPDYKSPYELAYPDGMKWYDYTMLGNTLGQSSHLFYGRNEQGQEVYARWGKQFRELPELMIDHETGKFLFPSPLINKVAGKVNPMVNTFFTLVSGHSLNGWENKDMKDTKGWDREVARLHVMAKAMLPYSIPTDADKEFMLIDLVMPTSKGMSYYKARNYMEKAILSGDMNYVTEVYKACVQNGIDPDKIFNVAKTNIESDAKKEMLNGVNDVSEASAKFNQSNNVQEKKKLMAYLEKQLSGQDYEQIDMAEMVSMARDFVEGKDVPEEKNEQYIMRATSDDVARYWRIKKMRAGVKEYYDTYKSMIDEDEDFDDPDSKEAINYRNQNLDRIALYMMIGKYQYRRNKLKKQLDGGAYGTAVMQMIRDCEFDLLKWANKPQEAMEEEPWLEFDYDE